MSPDCIDLVNVDVEGQEFPIQRSFLAVAPLGPRDNLIEYKPAELGCGPPTASNGWLQSLDYELRSVYGIPLDPTRLLLDDNHWTHFRAGVAS